MTFPEYVYKGQQSDPRAVHRKAYIKQTNFLKLAKLYAHVDSYSECLRGCEVTIVVIREAKAKLSTKANSKKVSTSKCDIDAQNRK